MTDLLQFKISVPKSRRQHRCTSQLLCEDRMLFVWVHLRISFCGQQHLRRDRTIRLVYKQKSDTEFRSGDSNASLSVIIQQYTRVHWNTFSLSFCRALNAIMTQSKFVIWS